MCGTRAARGDATVHALLAMLHGRKSEAARRAGQVHGTRLAHDREQRAEGVLYADYGAFHTIETVAMTPEKASGELKGAVVFVAPFSDQKAKQLRAQAEAAGAKVVDELTPNVDILIGDDNNRLVQEAHDFEVSVWSVADFITATAGAAPPPPPPGKTNQDEVSKKTIYVRRFPALPGEVACNNGMAAALAYSWMTDATATEIERGLRFLLGAADNDSLRLLNSRGCEVPITSGLPHGALLTVQIVPTMPSAPPPLERCTTILPDQDILCYNSGQCSTRPCQMSRSLPAPLRSAIHKRQRDQGQWEHRSTKKYASASAMATHMPTETSPIVSFKRDDKRDEAKEGRTSDKAQEPLDDTAHHEATMRKLDSEAVAMETWATRESAPADVHTESNSRDSVEIPDVPEITDSSVEQPSPPGGVAAAGKAKLRKLVDSAKVVIKKVSNTVAAVQKSSSHTKPSSRAASEREMAPKSRLSAAGAVRSAHKQAVHWLPSRPRRSDSTTPLASSTPV